MEDRWAGEGGEREGGLQRYRLRGRNRLQVLILVLETAPVETANSASSWRNANAGGPARPYVSWDRGTTWHAPVPEWPYLSRFNASLASADTPVPQASVATAEDASECVTHTSATTGRPGRYRRRSPRWDAVCRCMTSREFQSPCVQECALSSLESTSSWCVPS